jgi:hypothetical protein
MAVGDVHDINGYVFTETLHGPNVEKVCIDCGGRAYGIPERDDHRCQPCSVTFHGAKSTLERVLGEGKRTPRLGPGLAEARAKENR